MVVQFPQVSDVFFVVSQQSKIGDAGEVHFGVFGHLILASALV